jgi:hypothetical protein
MGDSMASKGRTSGAFSKDLLYKKFYVILFKYRDDIYVYSDVIGKNTFHPINRVAISDLEDDILVHEYSTKEQALSVSKLIPEFEIGGSEVELEVVSNVFLPELFA